MAAHDDTTITTTDTMKAICDDDLVIDCAGYKAIDSGVVLLADEDRKDVVGFVPDENLQYVLPDDVVEREHERLGLPAPEVGSPDDLETRLDEFAAEIEDLRDDLDEQVEDTIDAAGEFDEDDSKQAERLRERRRTIDRQLVQVRQRARQLRQLSSSDPEPAVESVESPESADEPRDVESLAVEVDERFQTIEERLEELASATDAATTNVASEGGATGAETEDDDESEPDLDRIDGLGPTYRDRLHDAGIHTFGDLAERSPEEVADAADAPKNRAASWIEAARELPEAATS